MHQAEKIAAGHNPNRNTIADDRNPINIMAHHGLKHDFQGIVFHYRDDMRLPPASNEQSAYRWQLNRTLNCCVNLSVGSEEGLMERVKRFRDRAHAGAELSRRLGRYKDAENTIVVGLARGGVPVAAALSEQLNLPCNVLVSRKIDTPEDRQCALGAVTETGVLFSR